jgi:peptidoglycan/LPS O-acetylase OafA/YrhL
MHPTVACSGMYSVIVPQIKRPPLPVLTSLRFFAALSVVVFHVVSARSGDALEFDGFIKELAIGGYSAVTFFFILSGFILTYAHAGPSEVDHPDIKPSTFWRLRFARIVPAYFLGLLLGLPLLVDFLQSSAPALEKAVGPVLALFFLQAWWPPVAEIWNYPAWSLSVEAVFYALFPWLSLASARLSRRRLFLVGYALIAVTTACRAVPPIAGNPLVQHFPLFHLPLFIFGMALGRQFMFGREMSPQSHAAMFGLGVVALVLLFGFGSSLPSWTRRDPVLVLVFSLIILGGARPAGVVRPLSLPLLVLLGEASYSIYILHVPIRLWWEGLEFGLPNPVNLSLYFGVLLVVSILSFQCVEKPLRKLLSTPRSRAALSAS